MRKIVFLLILTLVLSGSIVSAADVVEAIVVRVGDRIVTRSLFAKRLREAQQIEKDRNSTLDPATIQKELLEEMVNELLVKDRADRLGISVNEAEVKDSIERLKAQHRIQDDNAFNESLRQSGLTRLEMEQRLKDSILSNKVFQRELRSREELTDRELRDRFMLEKENYRLPERAKLREIIVMIPPNSNEETRAALRKKAEEAAEKARTTDDFPALATLYSDAPSKAQGGEMGEVTRGELLNDLDSGVFKSDAGAILGPIETRFGFHVLKVEQRLPSETPSFESIKDKLRQEAGEEAFKRDLKNYLATLRKDAFVQIFEQNVPKG